MNDTINTANNNDASLLIGLEKRKSEGLYRQLTLSNDLIDFASNDYLGFAHNPLLLVSPLASDLHGSTGSRLISGNSALAEQTERQIAQFHTTEAALIYNTGYMANVGLFSCLAQKDDTYIADEHIHASMIDGMRLSYAKRLKFEHNNIADLEKKLQKAQGNIFVAIESLYSMGGDTAPLEAIADLCQKYHAALIVDEAHATGVYGSQGEGIVQAKNLQNKVWARIHTFSKALGIHGAAIVGSEALRQYLINHSRAFIYATAPPPHFYRQIQKAYSLLPASSRDALVSNIQYFRAKVAKLSGHNFIDSHSPIQGLIIPDNEKIKHLAQKIQANGIYVKAIVSPTVAYGTERIRICLHSFNTKGNIDLLLNIIEEKP